MSMLISVELIFFYKKEEYKLNFIKIMQQRRHLTHISVICATCWLVGRNLKLGQSLTSLTEFNVTRVTLANCGSCTCSLGMSDRDQVKVVFGWVKLQTL